MCVLSSPTMTSTRRCGTENCGTTAVGFPTPERCDSSVETRQEQRHIFLTRRNRPPSPCHQRLASTPRARRAHYGRSGLFEDGENTTGLQIYRKSHPASVSFGREIRSVRRKESHLSSTVPPRVCLRRMFLSRNDATDSARHLAVLVIMVCCRFSHRVSEPSKGFSLGCCCVGTCGATRYICLRARTAFDALGAPTALNLSRVRPISLIVQLISLGHGLLGVGGSLKKFISEMKTAGGVGTLLSTERMIDGHRLLVGGPLTSPSAHRNHTQLQ